MRFLANLIIGLNQLIQAVLHRVTTATIAATVTARAQIAYNDDVNKIIYNDGTAVQIVASEDYVASEITNNALTVAPASAALIDITGNEISLKALAIQKVLTDATSTTLALALAARTPVYNATNVGNGTADLQEGDILILAGATGGMQVYIQNGGVLGTTADFTLMETPNLDNAAIRALLSATNGVTYNATTGEFKIGGTLTESRTISTGTNWFTVGGTSINNGRISMNTQQVNIGKALTCEMSWTDTEFQLTTNSQRMLIGDSRAAAQRAGLEYNADYSASFSPRSLVDKGYVDGVNVKRSTQTVTTVADTWLTVTHNFALADKDSVVAALSLNGVQVMAEVEFMTANTLRIKTSTAVVGLKVFMLA